MAIPTSASPPTMPTSRQRVPLQCRTRLGRAAGPPGSPLQGAVPPGTTARERVTPQCLEAEQAVLGAMLMEPEAIRQVLCGWVDLRAVTSATADDDFYRVLHRKVFRVIVALFERGESVDLVTAVAELRQRGELEEVGGAAYLTALIEACPTAANVKAYLRSVVATADARQALSIYAAALDMTYAGEVEVALEQVATAVANLREGSGAGGRLMASGLAQRVNGAGQFTPALEVTSAYDLLHRELPEPTWAVPDVLPAGFNILAGKPKVGKSWMALNLALAVASGGAALGGLPVQRGAVLYLALEDTFRRLQERMVKLLQGHADLAPPQLHLATCWPSADRGGTARLEHWLQAHGDARLVVLDVFERIRPPRLRGGNSYAEDYQAVLPLKALCDRYGIAMLVLHHVTKLPYDDPVDSVSGTLGFVGAADGVLVLRREAGTTATLFMRGRDVEQREIALRWSPEVGSWTTLGEVESHRQSQQRRQILELLREADGPLSPQEIAAMLHHDYGNVRRLLFSLFHAGEVRKAARGQYVLGSGSQLPVIGRQLGRPEDKAIVCD